jgi:Gas vesicle synthesis protein GvpO
MAQQSRSNGKVLSPAEAVRAARQQTEEMLGRETETVSAFSRDDSNGWVVTIEVVDLERIPATTSVLASYEAHLDRNGDLVELKRLRRYSRNQIDQGGGDDE